eukprot:scaffold36344_cov56-Cyclotella_meneghiniana.AAC.4
MATFDDIAYLCRNRDDLSESVLVEQLISSQIDPDVLATTDDQGRTLLHIAVVSVRSPEFCNVLIYLNPALVKARDNDGWLPLHLACFYCNMESAKYLLEIYPESINIATIHSGDHPLHSLLRNSWIGKDDESDVLMLVDFVLKHGYIGAVSTPNQNGCLLLHYACYHGYLVVVEHLFDAYPQAIFSRNRDNKTPLDVARSKNQVDVVLYLETQLMYRQFIIHEALEKCDISLGAIKLIVEAYPTITGLVDSQGYIPLHLACKYGHLNIVKYLVDQNNDSLTTVDSGGNLPLHHACVSGKSDIINYILMMTDHGVSVQNKIGKLPIQLFLFNAECDRSSMEFMDAVYTLLRANPVDSLKNLCPRFADRK